MEELRAVLPEIFESLPGLISWKCYRLSLTLETLWSALYKVLLMVSRHF